MPDIKRTTLCYLENDGCWLMLYRDRKPDDMNEGKWLGIGGKIEPGETPDECNAREVLEETGLRIRSTHFYGVIRFRADSYEDEDMYLYSSDDFEPADEAAAQFFRVSGTYEPPACNEGLLRWIDKNDVPGLPLWEGDRAFIRQMLAGRSNISMTLSYEGEKCTVTDDLAYTDVGEETGMDDKLRETCELLIENRDALRELFKWEGSEMLLLGSALLTSGGSHADKTLLKNCERMIRDKVSRFSVLRGNLKMAAVCRMAASEDPERLLENTQRAYDLIRIFRRRKQERYYLAGLCMSDAVSDKEDLLALVDNANAIYDGLRALAGERAAGPFADDVGYSNAAAIAASGVTDIEGLLAEAEKCAKLCAEEFGDCDSVWMLGLVLALDSTPAEFKVVRLKEICSCMKELGTEFGVGDQLPALGALARVDLPNAEIASHVAEADAYLRNQKGFGFKGTGADRRHMYAAMMVIDAFMPCSEANAVLASAVLEGALEAQFRAMATNILMM